MSRTRWDILHDRLMSMTMKQIREVARDERVCLGYAASRKQTAVDEIVSFLRYREEVERDER